MYLAFDSPMPTFLAALLPACRPGTILNLRIAGRMSQGHLHGIIGGSVIDHDELEVRERLGEDGVNGLADVLRHIVGRGNHRHRG